ncbi:MAG: radical SAM protein [bacterium]
MDAAAELVLVNPPIGGEERYGELAGGGNYMPPLGICILANCARSRGVSVAIVDAERLEMTPQQACSSILDYSPAFVGITATTTAIHNAAHLAGLIRQSAPQTTIIAGGPHVSIIPEETMSRFPQFDCGVLREGESTLFELMDAIKNKRKLDTIPGIVRRENGAVKINPHRPFISDLDTVPFPAWDLLPCLPRYYRGPVHSYIKLPNSSLVTTRGCPGQCTFCSQWSIFRRVFRAHSAEYVFEMMEKLWLDYRVRDVYFLDDTFTVDRERIVRLCEILISRKWKQVWSCQSRVNFVDPEMLSLMKRAGCWQTAYGVESGSQLILDFLKKGVTLDQIRTALLWTKKAGIRTRGFFMIGVPRETTGTIRETIAFSRKLPLDDLHVSLFVPYPGSELYETACQFGDFNPDWRRMNGWFVVFVPSGLTEAQLIAWQKTMFRAFYFRPRIIISYLKLLSNPVQLKRAFTGLFGLLNFLIRKKSKKTDFCT